VPQKPAGLVTGEFMVYDAGTALFKRSTVQLPGPTSLGSGTPDATKFLRGDGVWQLPTGGPTITRALTPPGSPADGDIWYYVDSLTATTIEWAFRWNAGSTNADKWEFIGGAPAYAEIGVGVAEATTSVTYVALTTAGPSITLARAGVYQVDISFRLSGSGANNLLAFMSYDIGGTGASDNDAVVDVATAGASGGGNVMRRKMKTGIAAATTLTAKYRSGTTAVSASFTERWMSVTPVRVS
jgi:hypothetical protein